MQPTLEQKKQKEASRDIESDIETVAINRCCTYPQGDRSLIPALMCGMAVISSLLALNVLPSSTGHLLNFVCYRTTLVDSFSNSINPGSALETVCKPLGYGSWDDETSYFSLISSQRHNAATAFGVISCVLGSLAAARLISAACFRLSEETLRGIFFSLVVSGVLAFLTMVNARNDVNGTCDAIRARFNDRYFYPDTTNGILMDPSCRGVEKLLGSGAICMLTSGVLYLLSAVFLVRGFPNGR